MIPNTEITVSLTPELRLEEALKGAGISDPKEVSKLTVLGKIRERDVAFIREKMTLQEIDLSNAIVDYHLLPFLIRLLKQKK